MSEHQEYRAHSSVAHHEAGHHASHHGEHELHADHGSFKSYLTGFILAVILTVIPFWLVMAKVFDNSSMTGLLLLGLAAVQVVVHMIYFLHMNTKSEGGWSMLALIFTVMLVFILLSGSLWVMYHLNHNMMPGMMHEGMHAMPSAPAAPVAPALEHSHSGHTMP